MTRGLRNVIHELYFETDVKKNQPIVSSAVDDVVLGKSFAKSFGWIVCIEKKD